MIAMRAQHQLAVGARRVVERDARPIGLEAPFARHAVGADPAHAEAGLVEPDQLGAPRLAVVPAEREVESSTSRPKKPVTGQAPISAKPAPIAPLTSTIASISTWKPRCRASGAGRAPHRTRTGGAAGARRQAGGHRRRYRRRGAPRAARWARVRAVNARQIATFFAGSRPSIRRRRPSFTMVAPTRCWSR